jgi:hypothetical protein
MQFYIRNTETKEIFSIPYTSLETTWSTGENTYSSADIPQVGIGNQKYFWKAGNNPSRTLDCFLDGSDTNDKLEKLKSWCQPVPGKYAPPICQIQVGTLVEWCVLTKVEIIIPLTHFKREAPQRAKATISYQIVSQ